MSVFVVSIYWIIVTAWIVIISVTFYSFLKNPQMFGTTRLLLIVILVDTLRNIVENTYFGVYFGSQYGLFPKEIGALLGQPSLLMLPKIFNIVAACIVFTLLIKRWLPMAMVERENAYQRINDTTRALEQEADENRRLFEVSADLIIVMDRDARITRISQSCKTILGFDPAWMVGHIVDDFITGTDLEAIRRTATRPKAGTDLQNFIARFHHASGNDVPLTFNLVWSDQAERFFCIARDMTETYRTEERLSHLAHFDQLTGLPNRFSLMTDLRNLLQARGGETGLGPAIALFDLDGFKDINDALGHTTGDRLLQAVSGRLQRLPQRQGRFYRLGGDEFLLVLEICENAAEAAELVADVLIQISEPIEVDNKALFVAASAGIAVAETNRIDVDELIANADLALYDAKASGGNTVSVFQPQMRALVRARQDLETELRRASAEHEFVLYYQPQIRMTDGAVVGAEALLRWQHPERGLLAPADFIQALSRSADALSVGKWILGKACEDAANWRSSGMQPVRIGVNLFPAQFKTLALIHDVEQALKRSGLGASDLELEITENIALTLDEATVTMLGEIRKIGVGLAFDDFGTGYASLSYLTKYPLTRLKIDRSFVNSINTPVNSNDAAIVRSIVMMAHNLGLSVIAEGVETIEQAHFLRDLGCEEVQGYYYARPMSERDFRAFCEKMNVADDYRQSRAAM